MKKAKAKSKGKTKSKKAKVESVPEVVINGQLDTITDHLKQILLQSEETMEQLEAILNQRLTNYPQEKLSKNLARALQHNPCFLERDGKWSLDKRGQEKNDAIYQWLSTTGYALNYKEIKSLAGENQVEIGPEKDLVWDGRFIRLKNGKWGLNGWKVLTKQASELAEGALALIKERGRPLSLEELCQGLNDSSLDSALLGQFLEKDGRFMEVYPELIYIQGLYEEMLRPLLAEDPLELFRQAEINVLQEAEFMLILNDAQPNSRKYILSSRDLERGTLTLNPRLAKIFRDLPPVSFLNFQVEGRSLGIWYLREQQVLVGFAPWYEENGLESGHIVEISWSKGEDRPEYAISFTGEREAEVYSEGVRLKKLNQLGQAVQEEKLDRETALIRLLELYPGGLKLEAIKAAFKAFGLSATKLEQVLRAYPFFEEVEEGLWRCNPAMKDSYYELLEQIRIAQEELKAAKEEAASALAEIKVLQQEKDSLQEELTYLQNHYREEQALYQQKISEMAMQNEHWHLENTRLKAELNRLKQREEELLRDMEAQGEQLVNLRQEKNKLKVKIEQLENKLVQVQSNLNRIMEDAQAEITRLQKMLQDKTSQLESLQYAHQEMHRNLNRLHEERRDMKRKLSLWPVRLVLAILGMTQKFVNKKMAEY